MGGMGGPVALNQLAIYPAMEMYNVEFKADCFEKVVAVGRKVLAKQRESVK